MVRAVQILLICALVAIVLPLTQADYFFSGGYGRLNHGTITDEGVVGGLLAGVFRGANRVICGTLGSEFLPIALSNVNECCPDGQFTSSNFESFEKLCKYYCSDPKLRRCFSSSSISVKLKIHGFSDITARIGGCCNLVLPRSELELLGDVGNGEAGLDIPRNPDALVNELGYGLTDGTSDLVCSLLGRKFIKVLISSDCLQGNQVSDGCTSMECFCNLYTNHWSSDVQGCMNTGAVQLLVNITGVIHYNATLSDCCARFPVNPLPRCGPISPTSGPKCGC